MVPLRRFFTARKDGFFRCDLCPHCCKPDAGSGGACKVRFNRQGSSAIPFYGFVTAMARDPVEKKPLYHYRPGSSILSVGFMGCNLRCPFCQNWHISQSSNAPGRLMSPGELIAAAMQQEVPQIAYTYSEPLVHIEFLLDCMKAARKTGIANVLVSNGCVNAEAAEAVLELTDAANIDLKCFSEETYAKTLRGNLEAVLGFMRKAVEKGVHLEATTLVVPGLNDSEAELDNCADFIASLSKHQGAGEKPEIPWHLSAYHRDWKWNAPPTDPVKLAAAASRAREKLAYVYTGNVAGEENETSCLGCGAVLVRRKGFRVETPGLTLKQEQGRCRYYCARCGAAAPLRY